MDKSPSLPSDEEIPSNLGKVNTDLSMLNENQYVARHSKNNKDIDRDETSSVELNIKKEIPDQNEHHNEEYNVDDKSEHGKSTGFEDVSDRSWKVSKNIDGGSCMSVDGVDTSDSEDGEDDVDDDTQDTKSVGGYPALQAQLCSNPGRHSSILNVAMGMIGPQQRDLLTTIPLSMVSLDRMPQGSAMSIPKAKKHRKVQSFLCTICGRTFTRNHSLKRHIVKIHNDIDRDDDGSMMTDEEDIDGQITGAFQGPPGTAGMSALEQQEDSPWVDELLEGSEGFGCKFCGKVFAQRLSLKRHIRRLHGKRPWTCGVCEMQFCEVGLLERHMRTHSGERPFECTICSAAFSKLGNLQRHEKIHTGIKPFSCDLCGKSFQSTQELKRHVRIHTKERPFKCTICEKTFSESCHLQRHMITHTGFKPFQCELCDKYFSQYDNLKQHMTTHTGEKPHKCPKCDKAFARQADVRKHLRVHTGERPFKCTVCEKGFSVSSTLHKHMLTHTGEKRFSCELCGRSFALNCNLKKHVSTHFKPKTFMCGVCQADFNEEVELEEHLISSHDYTNEDSHRGSVEVKKNEAETVVRDIVHEDVAQENTVAPPETGHSSDSSGDDGVLEESLNKPPNTGNPGNHVESCEKDDYKNQKLASPCGIDKYGKMGDQFDIEELN